MALALSKTGAISNQQRSMGGFPGGLGGRGVTGHRTVHCYGSIGVTSSPVNCWIVGIVGEKVSLV